MGARGPARTPTTLLAARGSALAKGRQQTEPGDEVAAPEMPPGLSEAAAAHWDYIVPKLLARRTISPADVGFLAVMCIEFAEYMEAQAELQSIKGQKYDGHLMDHPRVRMKSAFERYSKSAVQFGLSPAAKSRVTVAEPKKQKKVVEGAALKIAS
jgi:P27 family predicted phage terminase small subunit